MRKTPRLAVILLLVLPLSALTAEESKPSHAEGACTTSEKWRFSDAIPELARDDFKSFLNKKSKSVHGFSEGLGVRRFVKTAEARLFGEYWISRSLYDGALPHIAFEGFRNVAARPVTAETAGIQLAAVECMNKIHKDHPSFALPADVAAQLPDLWAIGKFPKSNEVIWEATGSVIQALVAQENPSQKAGQEMLMLLKGSGPHLQLAEGIWAARHNEHKTAIRELGKFVGGATLPDSLQRYKNSAHILLARSYYSTEQFELASAHLKLVSRASNELANSLSELGWSYLMAERYSEAIGTSMNLEAGGMRHTFAPEAPMVMSMALNELCQYPESIRAIDLFKKRYEKPYRWLSSWSREAPLYPKAVQFLRRQGDVPDKVASEWVRSPTFISSQGEINLLFQERDASNLLSRAGLSEQKKLAEDIIKRARELKPRIRFAKKKLKPGQELSRSMLNEVEAIRRSVEHMRRLQLAAPVWKTILTNYKRSVPSLESKLLARINSDLKARTLRMAAQIEEIAENTQLIEVEIFNGASQDIIWQNAHPDYKEIAQQMKNERQLASQEKVYNWGTMNVGSDEAEEVWEDELGSFKSSLFDNCNSKDKYLAIKKVRVAGGN